MGHWACPSCGRTAVTGNVEAHTPFHPCPKAGGLDVPFVADGTKAKLVVVERGDYIGRERVQLTDEGRPVMSVLTVRDDGQDATVYAPCAEGGAVSDGVG